MIISPAGVSRTLSTGAGPFQDGIMLVSSLSLLRTDPIIDWIPFRSPRMMLTPAFHSQDPAPEKIPMICPGMELTKLMTPLTPADTALRMRLHAEVVRLVAAFHPELMTLLTEWMAEDTTLRILLQAEEVTLVM